MVNRVYTKVIYNITIKAVQRIDDNTEVVKNVIDLSENVSGLTVFNPYVAQRKIVRLSNSLKEELERVAKLEEKTESTEKGGSKNG